MTTSAREWKKSTAAIELDMPSGHTALVRRPDSIKMFMQQGLVPNLLMPIVEKALSGGEEGPDKINIEDIAKEVVNDVSKIQSMIDMQDAVVVSCVVAPVVEPIPVYTTKHAELNLCVPDRVGMPIPFGSPHRALGYPEGPDGEPDVPLFVDEVDAADKQFIFSYCLGGVRDLERFRKQSGDALERVEAVARSGGATE